MRPRVLIAHDDQTLREALLAGLREEGIGAIGVEDAADLIALATAAAEDPTKLPELIIADLCASGPELISLLESLPRQVLWKVPIIVVSREFDASLSERARRIGCAVVVPRPLGAEEMRQLALALLPGPRP